MKLLGLDFGIKWVGYAISDENQSIVFPREVIAVKSQQKLLVILQKIIAEEGIGKIVVGLPLDDENKLTDTAMRARKFSEKIKKLLKIPVVYVDEYGTSKAASEKMQGALRKKHGQQHAIAAQLILEKYLEENH